jgi:hypothetical protein
MTKKRKKRRWPPELKGPFPLQKFYEQAEYAFCDVPDPDHAAHLINKEVRRLWEAEAKRRVSLLSRVLFRKPWPENEVSWLELIFKVCAHLEAPGFKIQAKSGRHRKWGGWQNARLFADVMTITTKRQISEYAAVAHITKNPQEFLDRYNEYKGKTKTLYDQFLRAKKAFDQTEHTDRLNGQPLNRTAAIKQEIDFYSAQADRKHEHQITQKSTWSFFP